MWPRRNKIERCTGGTYLSYRGKTSNEVWKDLWSHLLISPAQRLRRSLYPLSFQPRSQETFRGLKILKASVNDQNLMT